MSNLIVILQETKVEGVGNCFNIVSYKGNRVCNVEIFDNIEYACEILSSYEDDGNQVFDTVNDTVSILMPDISGCYIKTISENISEHFDDLMIGEMRLLEMKNAGYKVLNLVRDTQETRFVTIEETLVRTVEVYGLDEEAINTVENLYDTGEIVLDSEYFQEKQIYIK